MTQDQDEQAELTTADLKLEIQIAACEGRLEGLRKAKRWLQEDKEALRKKNPQSRGPRGKGILLCIHIYRQL